MFPKMKKTVFESIQDIGFWPLRTTTSTSYFNALKNGYKTTVQWLTPLFGINNTIYCDQVYPHSNLYPLYIAARFGQRDLVEILHNSGANVEAVGSNGVSALLAACKYGHIDTVKYLLENGADPNAIDSDGNTALMSAALLGDDEYSETTLKIMKLLIEYGANNVNAISNKNDAVLHFVVKNMTNPEIVELLIDNGADPILEIYPDNPFLRRSENALLIAGDRLMHYGYRGRIPEDSPDGKRLNYGIKILKLLLEKMDSVKINNTNRNSHSILDILLRRRHSELAMLALTKGAKFSFPEKGNELTEQNKENLTACLHNALLSDDLRPAKLFLKKLRALSAKDRFAILNNFYDPERGFRVSKKTALQTLIGNYVDNMFNNNYPKNQKLALILDLIKNKEVDINLGYENNNQVNPFNIACMTESKEIIDAMLNRDDLKLYQVPSDRALNPLVNLYKGHLIDFSRRVATWLPRSDEKMAKLNISDILRAIKTGDIKRWSYERITKSEINQKDWFGLTPLMIAVILGDHELVKTLLNVPGIELALEDQYGLSALEHAICCNETVMIQLLLQPSFIKNHERTAHRLVTLAIEQGRFKLLKSILTILKDQGLTIIMDLNKKQSSIYRQDYIHALLFMEFHYFNSISLSTGLKYRDYKVLDYKHNKDILKVSPFKQKTAMRWFVFEDHKIGPEYWGYNTVLGQSPQKIIARAKSKLIEAIVNDNISAALALINDPNTNINEQDENGYTALNYAAQFGCSITIVEALLQHPQIDVNLAGHNMRTPLHAASAKGRIDILPKLLAHKNIDLEVTDNQGRKFYHCFLAHFAEVLDYLRNWPSYANSIEKTDDMDIEPIQEHERAVPMDTSNHQSKKSQHLTKRFIESLNGTTKSLTHKKRKAQYQPLNEGNGVASMDTDEDQEQQIVPMDTNNDQPKRLTKRFFSDTSLGYSDKPSIQKRTRAESMALATSQGPN